MSNNLQALKSLVDEELQDPSFDAKNDPDDFAKDLQTKHEQLWSAYHSCRLDHPNTDMFQAAVLLHSGLHKLAEQSGVLLAAYAK